MKLSKREIVMLVILLIFAIVFIEYRFVVVPGFTRLDERKAEQAALSEQVSQIKINLATFDMLNEKLQENIDAINRQSKPFYDGLMPDFLLDLSRDLLLRNGLEVNEYTAQELTVVPIDVPDTVLQEMSYQLKLLAQQYRDIKSPDAQETSPDPVEQPGQEESNVSSDELELYKISISAVGTYEQIRNLLADIESQSRTIRVNDFIVNVDQLVGKLDLSMTLEFYGITWLFSDIGGQDADWPREQINGGNSNPYIEVTPTPNETTTVATVNQEPKP